jgi:hypothetical protein
MSEGYVEDIDEPSGAAHSRFMEIMRMHIWRFPLYGDHEDAHMHPNCDVTKQGCAQEVIGIK